MSIEVIKNLKTELDALKADMDNAKSVAETIKAIEARIDAIEHERKKSFEVGTIDERMIKKAANDAANLVLKAKLLGRDVKSFDEFKQVANIVEKAIKPADVSAWLDEQFSKQVIDLMEYDLKIEKLFGSVVVPNGVSQLSFPRKTARSKAYLNNPAQDAIESALQGDKVSFSPVKLKTLVVVSDEAKNEAVVNALLDVVKEDIAYSLAIGIENALVNGDVSGDINENPAATDVTKAFDGLRKYGLNNSVDAGGDAITVADIRAAVKQMGVFGTNPSECVLVVNPRVYAQLKDIPELQTIDKIGNSAVLKTGTVGMIDGMQIIVTDFIPNNLDANGKVDTSTPGTATAALVVNTKAFKVGKRNLVEFEQDRNIVNDTTIYTGRVYRDFKQMYAGIEPIAEIINIGG
jgi:HK97 family phage major capsid protein